MNAASVLFCQSLLSLFHLFQDHQITQYIINSHYLMKSPVNCLLNSANSSINVLVNLFKETMVICFQSKSNLISEHPLGHSVPSRQSSLQFLTFKQQSVINVNSNKHHTKNTHYYLTPSMDECNNKSSIPSLLVHLLLQFSIFKQQHITFMTHIQGIQSFRFGFQDQYVDIDIKYICVYINIYMHVCFCLLHGGFCF